MRKLCSILMLVSLFIAPSAYAKLCAHQNEKQALNSRALQSLLMVSAISCGQQGSYNQFVKKFQPYLANQHKILQSYFTRIYSHNAAAQLNAFMTVLANESSKRSLQNDSEAFCQTAKDLFTQVMGSKNDALITLAAERNFSSLHGVNDCRE